MTLTCYFGAEACRNGHLPDCPGAAGNPFEETTQPGDVDFAIVDAEGDTVPVTVPGLLAGTLTGDNRMLTSDGQRWTWDVENSRWCLDA